MPTSLSLDTYPWKKAVPVPPLLQHDKELALTEWAGPEGMPVGKFVLSLACFGIG